MSRNGIVKGGVFGQLFCSCQESGSVSACLVNVTPSVRRATNLTRFPDAKEGSLGLRSAQWLTIYQRFGSVKQAAQLTSLAFFVVSRSCPDTRIWTG